MVYKRVCILKEVVGNMKRLKRVLSVLLAIAMIIGTMPESGLFASAEGTESYWVDVDLEMTGGKIEGVRRKGLPKERL